MSYNVFSREILNSVKRKLKMQKKAHEYWCRNQGCWKRKRLKSIQTNYPFSKQMCINHFQFFPEFFILTYCPHLYLKGLTFKDSLVRGQIANSQSTLHEKNLGFTVYKLLSRFATWLTSMRIYSPQKHSVCVHVMDDFSQTGGSPYSISKNKISLEILELAIG